MLLTFLGLIVLVGHDLSVAVIDALLRPGKRDMLGFGIHLNLIGWAFALLLPLSIGLGELWAHDRKRYIPHIVLLLALATISANTWSLHPNRTLLFAAFCFSSLPLRWLIDRFLQRKTS